MTLEEKGKELGTRLAQSLIPEALKTTILEFLPKLTEHELDLILFALREEEGELIKMESALKDFIEHKKSDWAALQTEEQRIADEEIEDFIADRLAQATAPQQGAA